MLLYILIYHFAIFVEGLCISSWELLGKLVQIQGLRGRARLVVDELDGPERVLVEDLDDCLGAVVEVEAEAAVDHEARVEATRLHLDAARRASGLTLAPALVVLLGHD